MIFISLLIIYSYNSFYYIAMQNPFKKVYYDCPECGDRVWAFPAYVGNRCWDCPGTIIHGIVKTTPVLRQAETVVDTCMDKKTKYSCSGCGADVWAYGQFAGQKKP